MEYIYQLKPLRTEYHQVVEQYAFGGLGVKHIERTVLRLFSKYRIQYYPRIEPKFGYVIRKIGISSDPDRRVRDINNDWRSGRTEYVEVPVYLLPVIYVTVLSLWLWYNVLIISILLVIFVVFILVFLVI